MSDPLDEFWGAYRKLQKSQLCLCGQGLAVWLIIKDDGQETEVCQGCADWWKKINPEVMIVCL
jgi:hypothetical protein